MTSDEPEDARYRNPPKFHGVEAAPGMEEAEGRSGSRRTSGVRSPELSALSGKAINEFDRAIRRMACVFAVEDDEMSVNEAVRYLKLDEKERIQSPLELPDGYEQEAKEWLFENWEGRK